MNEKLLLTALNIHKTYAMDGKKLNVLKGVDVSANEGEVLIIQGPSGAGKSTLLHILGLLDAPTSGEVVIDGKVFKKGRVNARLRAKYIGFIFQFYNLLSDFNVLENVCLPAMVANGRFILSRSLKKQALGVLDLVGLSHRLNHRPGELSGGEQQRAGIARALINNPRIVLADEPTGNLDSENASKIWELLMQLRNERKQTIIVVTHNEEIAKKGDKRIRLVDGKVV